ncbi:hypothetical protein Peetri_00023 [Pseudomonas phage vB_PpuM-Peetri]
MSVVPNRVSLVDKRIFNGKADVNALLPLRYPWAYDAYVNANKNHWLPGDIHLDLDRVNHKHQAYWPAVSNFLISVAQRAEIDRQHMLFVYRATTAPEVRQRFLRMGQEDTIAIMLAQDMGLALEDFVPSPEVVLLTSEKAYLAGLMELIERKLLSVAEGKYILEEVPGVHQHIRKAVENIHRDVDSQLDFLFTLLRTFLGECETNSYRGCNTQAFWQSSNQYHAHLNSIVLNILTGAPVTPTPYQMQVVADNQTKDTLTWD